MSVIKIVDMNQIKSTSGPEIIFSPAKGGISDRKSSDRLTFMMWGKNSIIFCTPSFRKKFVIHSFFYGGLINISVLTTMRCCPLTSVATALIMATILHIMTPASTIKSGIRVWTGPSRGGERCRNPSWKMVTIPFLGGVLRNQEPRAKTILGLNHPRQTLYIHHISPSTWKKDGIYNTKSIIPKYGTGAFI